MKMTLGRSVRLYMEYALIAIIIVAGVFGTWYYVEGLKLKNDLRNVSTWALELEEANADNQKALEMTRTVAEANATMLTGLADAMEGVSQRDRELDVKISALEKSNEAVRAYLDARIPSGCVLDNTCGANGGTGDATASRPTAKVPAAQADPNR